EGREFCHFSIAVNEGTGKKDKEGKTIKDTTWYNATCVGNIADLAMAYLKKGYSVYLEGMPSTHLFNGSKGVEISNDIFITNLQLLPKQKAKNNDEPEHPEDFNSQQYEQENLEKTQQLIAEGTAKTKAKTGY
ncbi:MAG: hypothetical protein FD167_559, partial [bacterium]